MLEERVTQSHCVTSSLGVFKYYFFLPLKYLADVSWIHWGKWGHCSDEREPHFRRERHFQKLPVRMK